MESNQVTFSNPPPFNWKNSIVFRIFILGAIAIALQIPILMIYDIVSEREMSRTQAIGDVTSTWGAQQFVAGPFLIVPYYHQWKDKDGKVHHEQRYASFSPEKLSVNGHFDTEIRKRGIFEVPLYSSKLAIKGMFATPDFSGWGVKSSDIDWKASFLVLGVSDTKAITEEVVLKMNDKSVQFEPGIKNVSFLYGGISAPVEVSAMNKAMDFDLSLSLRGSSEVKFQPAGAVTNVAITSDWPDPKFDGSYLPVARKVTDEGFEASWSIPYLGRNYPKRFRNAEVNVSSLAQAYFGVNMISPVDAYRMSRRTVKYEFVFILLTFTAFFLFEIMAKIRIHPIQYLLVGCALVLFYLLTLSLAEHIGFSSAYIIASCTIVGMIGTYSATVLARPLWATLVACGLGIVYSFLFTLLQLQDFSLMFGSFGLVFVLGVVMFVTRKIDWYAVGRTTQPST